MSERAMLTPGPLVRLDIGEPDLPESDFVVLAAQAHLAAGTRYTPAAGMPAVREAVATFSTKMRDTPATMSNVVMTIGANGGITTALHMLVETYDEVLIPTPGFPVYRQSVQLLGGKPLAYHLTPRNDWQPDIDELERLAGPLTKAMILCSPSNPIGRSIDQKVLAQIVAFARRHGLVIIADEVYDQMIFEGEPLRAYAAAPDCVIGLYSFSKNYCMTGHRIGYALLPADLVGPYVRTSALLMSCPPSTAQAAALAAIEGPQEDVARRTAIYRERRDAVATAVAATGLAHWIPDGTFYFLLGLPPGTDSLRFCFDLLDRGVAASPGTAFGPAGEAGTSYLRLSLTKPIPDLLRGVEIIAAAVAELVSAEAGPVR
ncbi:MAG: pyridoxal phosphate-dependent aminotransferase [Microbacterium sp.]